MSTTDRRLAPMLRMNGAVPLLPVYDFGREQGRLYLLPVLPLPCVQQLAFKRVSTLTVYCCMYRPTKPNIQEVYYALIFASSFGVSVLINPVPSISRQARLPSFLGPFLFILPWASYYGANIINYCSPFFCTCILFFFFRITYVFSPCF